MVPGHLQIKGNYYYTVLNYVDEDGNRRTKWQTTGLLSKNNKKRAEAILMERRIEFLPPEPKAPLEETTFADFMLEWLEHVRHTIETVTYASYSLNVKEIIVPFFRKRNILLRELTAHDIQKFYNERLKTVKASSVKRYHANIHKALKYAVKMEMIPYNPADRVDLPKQERFIGSFYDTDEAQKLLEVVKGTKLELAVTLALFYGLRRSEIVGLRWDAIDFKSDTITIKHTVTTCHLDGKTTLIASDRGKSKASLRTLPLMPKFKEILLAMKEEQAKYRKMCGRSYNVEFLDYIYVDEMGTRISPGYITGTFPKLLEKHGLRHIRFHDLRHTAASLLLASGVPMKQIQEWLGHSDFSTTANIYAHLDYSSKLQSAKAMEKSLKF